MVVVLVAGVVSQFIAASFTGVLLSSVCCIGTVQSDCLLLYEAEVDSVYGQLSGLLEYIAFQRAAKINGK